MQGSTVCVLQEVGRRQVRIADSYHLGDALTYGCATVVELLGCDYAAVALRFGDDLRLAAASTPAGEIRVAEPLAVALDLDDADAHRSEPLMLDGLRLRCDGILPTPASDSPLTTVLAPIVSAKGASIGLLAAEMPKSHDADAQDRALLVMRLVASALASALDGNRRWADAIGRRAEAAHELVAQQLHDWLAQDAIALGLALGQVADLLDAPLDLARSEAAVAKVDEAKALCERLKEGIYDLMAQQREGGYGGAGGLIEQVEDAIERLRRRDGAKLAFIGRQLDEERLTPEVRDLLIMTVREAMTNIHKHADAHSGFVRLEMSSERVLLVIQNDGVGTHGAQNQSVGSPEPHMDADRSTETGMHFGLVNLSSIAARLGGQITSLLDDEEGTFTLAATVPLAPTKENADEAD